MAIFNRFSREQKRNRAQLETIAMKPVRQNVEFIPRAGNDPLGAPVFAKLHRRPSRSSSFP
jgi:hypothetical protein